MLVCPMSILVSLSRVVLHFHCSIALFLASYEFVGFTLSPDRPLTSYRHRRREVTLDILVSVTVGIFLVPITYEGGESASRFTHS